MRCCFYNLNMFLCAPVQHRAAPCLCIDAPHLLPYPIVPSPRIDQSSNPPPQTQPPTGLEVIAVSSAMTFLSFLLPLMWRKCTPLPSGVETEGWTEQEKVRYHCVVVIVYLQASRHRRTRETSPTIPDPRRHPFHLPLCAPHTQTKQTTHRRS